MKHSIVFFFLLLILNCNTNATSGFKIQIESSNTKISVDDEISISVSSTGKKIIDSVNYYLNGEKVKNNIKLIDYKVGENTASVKIYSNNEIEISS